MVQSALATGPERVKLHAVTNPKRLVYESVYQTVREGLPESRDVS